MDRDDFPDELLEEFARFRRALSDTTDDLISQGDPRRRNLLEEERDRKKADEIRKKEQAARDQQAAAIVKHTQTVMSLSRQLTGNSGSFQVLNSAVDLAAKGFGSLVGKIPVVGGIFKGAVEGAAEAAKFMTDMFEKAYGNFEQIAESGVVQRFEDLNSASFAMRMTFADLSKILTKNSKELAAFGGSAVQGRQEFELIAAQSAAMREEFQKLGISSSEFNDTQMSYISYQRRMGQLEGKSRGDLVAGTKTYIEQLDMLSKITGLNKKDLQSQRDAAMSETRFRASLMEIQNKDVQEAALRLNSIISSQAPALAQGFRDLMSGSVTTDAAKSLVLKSGGAAEKIMADFKAGKIDEIEADKRLRTAIKQTTGQFAGVAKHIGDASLVTQNYAEAVDYANRADLTPEQREALKKEQQRVLKETGSQNEALAKTKTALNNAAINMEQLATSSSTLPAIMGYMAEGFEWLTETLYEVLGKDLPDHLKARKEERKAIEEETKARKKATDLTNELPNEEKKLEELKAKLAVETDNKQRKILENQIAYSQRQIEFLKSDSVKKAKEDAKKVLDDAAKKREAATKKAEEAAAAAGGLRPPSARSIAPVGSQSDLQAGMVKTAAIEPAGQVVSGTGIPVTSGAGVSVTTGEPSAGKPPFDMTKYLKATALVESGGRAGIKAGTSSAGGLFQFIDSTWSATVKEMGKDYTAKDKYDPKKAAEVMKYFTEKQKSQLEKSLKTTDLSNTDLYMAHFLGAEGAAQFIKGMRQKPDAIGAEMFPKAAKANLNIFYDVDKKNNTSRPRTLAEIYKLMERKIGGAEQALESGQWGQKEISRDVLDLKAQMGGIFSGSSLGYPVELHGTEAVVPLPDGKTIPVEIKKNSSSPGSLKDFNLSDVGETVSKAVSQSYQQIQETTNRSSEKFDTMAQALNSMSSKLDSVIDALITGNRIQRNLLNNTV